MKRIVLCLTALLLLFIACEKNCLEKKPKNLKPIDWENYNDVPTVFWNLYSLVSKENVPPHTEIMVYGWVHNKNPYGVPEYCLVDDPNRIHGSQEKPLISLEIGPELQTMFDTCNYTKKCFVKGKLLYNHIIYGYCKIIEPRMNITNINDINFE